EVNEMEFVNSEEVQLERNLSTEAPFPLKTASSFASGNGNFYLFGTVVMLLLFFLTIGYINYRILGLKPDIKPRSTSVPNLYEPMVYDTIAYDDIGPYFESEKNTANSNSKIGSYLTLLDDSINEYVMPLKKSATCSKL